ncbi:DUF5906 domain-containing protein [Gordonia humi]|uniref:DUF5906 domain-containing protein n=1 Tax=Gordonia humi TaxID=686429 RepID=UPI00360F2EEB
MNGPGGSGKGTFGADLPRALFARYFRTMDGGYFLKRNATGKHRGNIADSITGARLVAVDEAIGTAAAIDTDFLKEFTGSATMHTERKHGTPGEAPRPLLTFLTNDTDMNFGKQDTGIRRRMIAVSLPWGADHREATGQTGDHRGLFRDLFEAEGSGVLNMYLDALDEVRANYAANGDPPRGPRGHQGRDRRDLVDVVVRRPGVAALPTDRPRRDRRAGPHPRRRARFPCGTSPRPPSPAAPSASASKALASCAATSSPCSPALGSTSPARVEAVSPDSAITSSPACIA